MNKVILMGRIGKDLELKRTKTGFAILNFSVATSERAKNRDTDEWEKRTEWHNVVALGKTAENIDKFLSKGSEVLIDGKIQTRKWEDKEGNNRYTTEIIANNVEFVGGKTESAGQSAPTPEPSQSALDDDFIPF